MDAADLTLEVLPAGYGDCLLVSCRTGPRIWRMLIDTGPDECYPMLRSRLEALPRDRSGRRRIDVFVVTHIDHDHIGGAAKLLSDRTLGLVFGDIWFNAPAVRSRGVKEGQELAELLGAPGRTLPWNKAFGGGPIVAGQVGEVLTLPRKRGWPSLTLVSPNDAALQALYTSWDRELARLAQVQTPRSVMPIAERGLLDVLALAARVSRKDTAVANASSIAFVLEHKGHTILLAADAVPRVLVPALRAMAPGDGAALRVDALKLAHHGSRGNVTRDLLRSVVADHYIVSTDGAIFNHPDDEAVARVLLDGGERKTLWFNHATLRNRRWAAAALRKKYGFDAVFPEGPDMGVRLHFGAPG
jgi:beta-lactamase superfamily II metal-dependent hydrolase